MKKMLVLLACAAVAGQGFAAMTWSENFEGYAVDTGLGDIGAPWAGGGNSYQVRDDATASPFGASNKWLDMEAWGSPYTWVNNVQPGTTVATLSFDIYIDPAVGLDGWLRTGLSRAGANLNFADIQSPNAAGTEVTIPTGQIVHLDILGNVSGSTVATDIGGSIGDGFLDVYVDGSYLQSATALGNGSGNIDGFMLWMNNGGTVDSPVDAFYIDNIEYWDTAHVIPEPATFGLLGLASIGIYAARKLRAL